ncbi:hypothetical protein DKX38_010280 [Salix brachista]|uniref:Lysosomal Pro-X carboxypeptidase n=1 Tax=Salix brachista TaxID=2182728 RepID=A0A5N5MD62_9ROSI|nr:hypothetical protein DKX38_010280 [Salix brachista]
MRIMATRFISLFFSLLFSLFSGISFAKPTPSFPSSIIRPEKISLSTPTEPYREKFFTQVLDHYTFRPQSYKTFQQRYLISEKYWGGAEKKAPIFLYTGNEGDIDWFAQNTGFIVDIAPHFKALLVFIEHRFYGKSMPFGGNKDVAYSNSSTLGYLTSTQALADYATLIIDLKKNLSAADSPVVVFGGSYGGMLAAWFRLKYPHIAIGALASSSPILNFENITSPYSFNNIITQDFRMCKAIDDPKTGNNTFAKLYGAASVYYNYSRTATCFDLDDDSDPHGLGGWSWQACTEMIMPTSGNNEDSIFAASTWSYDDRAASCEAYFGVEPRPSWITTEFGGHDIKRVLKRFGSNIIFFNGLRDPWSGGGVLENISRSIVAIVAEQGAHHVDLRFATSEDPKWLRDVREREVNIIAKWLSEYYDDLDPAH